MRLVDEGRVVANGVARPGRTPKPRAAARPIGRARTSALLLPVVLLVGCAGSSGAPSLHEVPPRPHPSYTAEQRRELGNALLADRELARREGQELRFRTGKTALPPPPEAPLPPRLPPVAEGGTAGPRAAPNLEAAIVEARVRAESDDGSLNSFLRQLVRRQPDAEPGFERTAQIRSSTLEPPVGRAGAEQPLPDTPALDRFLEHLGGVLAVGRPTAEPAAGARDPEPGRGEPSAEAPPPPAAAPPEGSVPPAARAAVAPPGRSDPGPSAPPAEARRRSATSPTAAGAAVSAPKPAGGGRAEAPPVGREAERAIGVVAFPAGVSAPPPGAREEVRRAIDEARRAGAGLGVLGRAETPALALERARRIARLVAEEGPPPGGLEVRAAGPGDRVELVLVPRPPS